MKNNTCCFSGHRRLPVYKIEDIKKRLNDEIDNLYRKGVTEYISGGALGFDQMAASAIIAKKELGYDIRLIFALPCKNQDEHWSQPQKLLYHSLLRVADEICYISNEYRPDCMMKRNQYMVECSSYCICALLAEKSGTGQTVRLAYKNNVSVINIAE